MQPGVIPVVFPYRVQELIAGVRSDIGISHYGDDLAKFKEIGNEIAGVIQQVPGAADVQPELTGGLPDIQMRIRRDQIARYGINAADVLDAISVIGGKEVGQVFEGQRRFPLQVRLGPKWREDVSTLTQIKIADPACRFRWNSLSRSPLLRESRKSAATKFVGTSWFK